MTVRLFRTEASNEGTFGYLVFGGLTLRTAELPDRANAPNVSRIPAGTYHCQIRQSPRYGSVYHVTGVDDRSYILFHHGNFSGDRALGYRTNSNGCILLGYRRGVVYGQKAVTSSRNARTLFESEMDSDPFSLEIIDGLA